MKAARGGVGERLHGPPLHSARGADSEQFWFVTAVWFSDRPSRYAAAQADAPKLDTARRLARTAASTRAVAVAIASLAVEVAAAGVEAPAMGKRWSRQCCRQHQRERGGPENRARR